MGNPSSSNIVQSVQCTVHRYSGFSPWKKHGAIEKVRATESD